MALRDRLNLVERHLRNSVDKRKRLLAAINADRKSKGLSPIKADVGDWKSFWTTIEPFVKKFLDLILSLIA